MKPLAKLTLDRQRLYRKSSCYGANGVPEYEEEFAGADAEDAFRVGGEEDGEFRMVSSLSANEP